VARVDGDVLNVVDEHITQDLRQDGHRSVVVRWVEGRTDERASICRTGATERHSLRGREMGRDRRVSAKRNAQRSTPNVAMREMRKCDGEDRIGEPSRSGTRMGGGNGQRAATERRQYTHAARRQEPGLWVIRGLS
jgi:hypothetical protein